MQKILIVEDEPDVADLVAFNLDRAGYQTVIAHDGLIGLDKAWSENPDLILLDYDMPRMNGIEVLQALKR